MVESKPSSADVAGIKLINYNVLCKYYTYKCSIEDKP